MSLPHARHARHSWLHFRPRLSNLGLQQIIRSEFLPLFSLHTTPRYRLLREKERKRSFSCIPRERYDRFPPMRESVSANPDRSRCSNEQAPIWQTTRSDGNSQSLSLSHTLAHLHRVPLMNEFGITTDTNALATPLASSAKQLREST